MTIKNKPLGKFSITKVANGFTLSVLNPDYKPGQSSGSYVECTFVSDSLEDLSKHLVTHIVTNKLEGK